MVKLPELATVVNDKKDMSRVVDTATRARKKANSQDEVLTVKLGDVVSLTVPNTGASLEPAITALKQIIASWKRKVRQALARSVEKAKKEAAEAEVLAEANETARRSEREALQGKAQALAEMAVDLETRTGWIWQDEVEDLLTPAERVFIGQAIENGDWVGGYWRGDYETRSTYKAKEKVDRRYVDYELIDSLAARKMFEIESETENLSAKDLKRVVEEYVAELTIGRKRDVKDDDE
jgi:hypothetical protein